jgi:hypothetical protein
MEHKALPGDGASVAWCTNGSGDPARERKTRRFAVGDSSFYSRRSVLRWFGDTC